MTSCLTSSSRKLSDTPRPAIDPLPIRSPSRSSVIENNGVSGRRRCCQNSAGPTTPTSALLCPIPTTDLWAQCPRLTRCHVRHHSREYLIQRPERCSFRRKCFEYTPAYAEDLLPLQPAQECEDGVLAGPAIRSQATSRSLQTSREAWCGGSPAME